jgi:hydrogenase assembly chaperone HypC/HupF
MCLAYPARVLSVEPDGLATVEVRGHPQRVVPLALDDRTPTVGEWLLVQSGLAVARIDAEEAAARTRLIEELTGGTP